MTPCARSTNRGRILTLNQAGTELCRQLFGGEPLLGSALFDTLSPEQRALWKERAGRTLRGEHVRIQQALMLEGRPRVMDINLNPLLGADRRPVGLTLFGRDITALKDAEARLGELHRSLLDVSRQAGMAEMANGILHNVGNTLNSVNVSAGLLAERLRGLRVSGVARASALLREHAHDLGAFFTEDPRGQQLPAVPGAALPAALGREGGAAGRDADARPERGAHQGRGEPCSRPTRA